jgi:hypothetical protein
MLRHVSVQKLTASSCYFVIYSEALEWTGKSVNALGDNGKVAASLTRRPKSEGANFPSKTD